MDVIESLSGVEFRVYLNYVLPKCGQSSLLVADWLSVLGDHNSNIPMGEKMFSSFVFEFPS